MQCYRHELSYAVVVERGRKVNSGLSRGSGLITRVVGHDAITLLSLPYRWHSVLLLLYVRIDRHVLSRDNRHNGDRGAAHCERNERPLICN